MPPTVVRSAVAQLRLARALAWLAARQPAEEVLVVAAHADAANELLRGALARRDGPVAAFGWHRVTLRRLAAELAAPALARTGAVPIGRLGAQAAAARVVHALGGSGGLGRYAAVRQGPGLARAFAGTLDELRSAGLDRDPKASAALAAVAPDLAAPSQAFRDELERAGLADHAAVFGLAARAAAEARPEGSGRPPLLGLPTLLLDVALESEAERALVAALVAQAPELLATAPAGDQTTLAHLEALGFETETLETAATSPSSLRRLQQHVFEEAIPAEADLDESVVVLSAPGESRECVEIARRMLELAREGFRFDRMAVLLRSPEEYRPHLEEAFSRAAIPVHFARGAVRPDPAGRAFVALLACAAEGLSARRFAEYLSLGQIPDPTAAGEPPPAAPAAERWVTPDEELVSAPVASALEAARADDVAPGPEKSTPETSVAAGTLRAPRRWERLLVDAAVIGGRERWQRRLQGLEHELELQQAELRREDADDPRLAYLGRSLEDLASLRAFALPLLDALSALPRDGARWAEWLDALSALASRALRRPERVLSVLAELAPMAEVGPVALDEVRQVLEGRLLEVAVPPAASRYGCVFVAPAEAARGLAFDVVFVPGLAERLFPKKITEEPILLDAARERLERDADLRLPRNHDRVQRERLALRLAVGAARRRLVLSYPRLDLDQSRPRVPSFYALEALRAAEGRLPGFDELAGRAERVSETRVGWPAPQDAADAIDEAEHDLALLRSLEALGRRDSEAGVGTARYLLSANPHLGRALRFRARRWLRAWTPADGLLQTSRAELSAGAREAIAAHGLGARSYSPTALQNFATCPYKFLLQAVHRLAPREMPEAIDEMDPLQRGSLVHDVQFELFRALDSDGLLPVRPENLARARDVLDGVLDAVAAQHHEDLAPAIERVWQDGVASVRADLREWLRRTSEDASGFVPWRFELAFGLPERRGRDPHSVGDPVKLACGIALRGSIDLVERKDGCLRVTDHKTGRDRVPSGALVAGGESLQPVLYALAVEGLVPDARVEAGRLYYCTSAGSFEEREVPLDVKARDAAEQVATIVGQALDEPFLPALPKPRACEWCDYNVVCGPYEERRTARKRGDLPGIEALARLRELR